MSSTNTPKFYIGLSIVLIGLVILIVREGEKRARSDARAVTLEESLQQMNAEKSTLVEELELHVGELEGRLQDAQIREQELNAARDAEVAMLNAQIEDEKAGRQATILTHEAAMAAKEAEMEGVVNLLKEKSGENQELAGELERASQKYSALLQKKEAIETRNLELGKKLSESQAVLRAIRQQTEAASTAAAATPPVPPDTAD